MTEDILTRYWYWFGIGTGAFWGIVAWSLYTPWNVLNEGPCHWKLTIPLQQFVFNFLCGFAGWYCLYIFEIRQLSNSWPGIAILIISIAGISGRLSHVMWVAAETVQMFIEKKMRKYLDTDKND